MLGARACLNALEPSANIISSIIRAGNSVGFYAIEGNLFQRNIY